MCIGNSQVTLKRNVLRGSGGLQDCIEFFGLKWGYDRSDGLLWIPLGHGDQVNIHLLGGKRRCGNRKDQGKQHRESLH